MADVFISYASEDRSAADEIAAALEQRGYACWIAPRDIRAGASWADAIAEAIGQSRSFLMVVSRHTSRSIHVAREIERADRTRKPIIPVFLEEIEVDGALGYYLTSMQWLVAYPGPIVDKAEAIHDAVRGALSEGAPFESRRSATIDDELVALARSICWDIRMQLNESAPESVRKVDEPKHGQEVLVADLAAVSAARRSIADWTARSGLPVRLVGEDVEDVTSEGDDIVCLLDALDGTQHWARGRNLWCTALSLFNRVDGNLVLRVSAVQMSDGAVFVAREDREGTFREGGDTVLEVNTAKRIPIDAAHVCTVSRRPDHFRVLAPHLLRGVPFAGLYTFGGNPILIELALGKYDAVFQPDASHLNDPQELFDWLPGGHIAFRSGVTILDLRGREFDLLTAANEAIAGDRESSPFVAAADPDLAREIARWLRSDEPVVPSPSTPE
ncbi:MAG TPA: TIR domain-containing protein [Acidimicrobiia bacterium]|nr:TIR domain-containing protein [Acidimicrobiia bacterium]